MDIGTSSFASQNSLNSVAQRKFYQWVLKWRNGINTSTDGNIEESRDVRNSNKPDVPILASFLQAIGFKLLSLEKRNSTQRKDEDDASTPDPGVITVSIECGSSNMKAILELGDITCRCPHSDHVKDASFWTISGTGPIGSIDNIVQKVEETGSNLLPRLSKDITRVLHDVTYRLFELIVSELDVNHNTDTNFNSPRSSSTSYELKAMQESARNAAGVARSYTEPEMRIYANSSNSNRTSKEKVENGSPESVSRNVSPVNPTPTPGKFSLQRQKTWDIDIETESLEGKPRPSPPKLASSPAIVTELSNSLGQLSLQDEIENPKNAAEYIVGAQQNLAKALKMLLHKVPSISIDVSPNLDNDVASIKSAPANISPAAVINPYKPSRASTIGNVKPSPRLSHVTHQHQLSTKPNFGNAGQSLKARRSIQMEQGNPRPPIRRNSSYVPSSANCNVPSLSRISDVGQKLLGTGRTNVTGRKTVSPELRVGGSQNLDTNNTPSKRTTSMIKPPTKIIKTIPVKEKTVQPSKISTGLVRKQKITLTKD
ncbi:uncharacterized protein LOC128886698 [Hylaeus anthracinus]|uniref:uncharacterized protein LOC128886698 n=1 Tax=Hylaeus anthracinus TaxID=313031 RepID=UPI0023B88613|nr:uncharacterized protein LOC128886698 [Hylaeus anthracinus]